MIAEEIVAKLAEHEPLHTGDGYECVFCGEYVASLNPSPHSPDCIWLQANNFVKQLKGKSR